MHPGTKDAVHQKYNSITYASQSVAPLLVMLLVELQNTCKKGWTEKRSNICYIFENMRVQGCQIWHSHSTWPQIIQLFPTMQKNLFTSSFQAKFLKIRFTKVPGTNFLFPQCKPLPGAYLGKNGPQWPTSNTQKMTKNGRIWAKNGKKRTAENFGTTYLDPK